jgi:hypothetical protein
MAAATSGKPDGRTAIPAPLHVVCLSPQLWRINLPTNRQQIKGMEPHVVVADGAEEFVAAIENALASGAEPDVEARRRLASANARETRTRRLLELVGAELE